MAKRLIQPNTTFYPAAVGLITTGTDRPNVMTCNRMASCSAEPPRLSVSIRPKRYSHGLIRNTGEFVLNLPTPGQALLADYVGVVSGREEDKFAIAGLRLAPALRVKTPLLADCPVNIECAVEHELDLDSHTLFIGRVLAVHAEESVLDENGDVDLSRAGGIAYDCGTVRERPAYKFLVDELRVQVQSTRAG
ncbi:MAG TPA: flavin reductase family protein [Anaerolineales bacterium]|nr:flavin reductase family protein [Anaerolineales bacterium]